MDSVSEARLKLVNPMMSDKVKRVAGILESEGITVRVTQGLRSWNEQAALYEQGRSLPGAVVTNSPAGYSWHNFGLAVDLVPMVDGSPDWDVKHPAWTRMSEVAGALGFTCGAHFSTPDRPHIQMNGRFPLSPDGEVRQLFKDGGMGAVWDEAFVPA